MVKTQVPKGLVGGEVGDGNEGVRLTDEQRIDWLRLIRSPNVGGRGLFAR
jgi:hypothetical protein